MKKIFLVLSRLDRGGAEMRILKLLQAINIPNLQFYVYLNSGQQGSLDEQYKACNNIELIYGKPGVSGLKFFSAQLASIKPDILHINLSLASGLYAMIGKLNGINYVISHLRTSEHYGNGLNYHLKQTFFKNLLNAFSDQVVGVCDGCRKLSNTPKDKWLTIYNGVEPLTMAYPTYNKYSLLCLGRMNEAKNQIFLIKVIAELVKKFPSLPWLLSFYGKENLEMKQDMVNLAKQLNVSNHVYFNGETNDPLSVITKHQLILLPSVREGLPGVVLEALSVGRRVIASDLPGTKEINRYIPYVEIMNDFDAKAWADKVYTISSLDNEEQAIKQYFEESIFSHDNHVRNMLSLWDV